MFLKSNFYDDGLSPSVASQRDPQKHGKQRRLLSNAFSAKALGEQEEIVQGYVDLLVKQVQKYATGEKGANMVNW